LTTIALCGELFCDFLDRPTSDKMLGILLSEWSLGLNVYLSYVG